MYFLDREALAKLSPEERERALEVLSLYQEQVQLNPLWRYEPHPKQQQFHASRSQLKAFLGGNRSGKTTAGILDDLIQTVDEDCLPDRLKPYKRWKPPFYCRIVVPDFKRTLEGVIFQKIREWVPRNQLLGGSFEKAYEKSKGVLNFANGGWWDFLTFEQDLDKFGGAALHRIHYDEEPPSNIRRESMMRLIDYGGDELFTMTPLHGMSWMYDQIWQPWLKHKIPHATVVVVDMDDNPYLDERTKTLALASLSSEERQARKSGRFVHFAGTIYEEFHRSEHVIPELLPDETGQRRLPAGARIYVGIDPGMRHMAGVVFTYLSTEDVMVVFDELTLQGHTIKSVCNAIKLVCQKWGQRAANGTIAPLVPDWYVIDPSARNIIHQTGRSDQMEFTDNGIITILGQNSVTAGINRVKERLQSKRLMVTANCHTLIEEFPKYRWATPGKTRDEEDPKEKAVKKDDHLLDALRYVVASRPYFSPGENQEQPMSPLEAAAQLELRGKTWTRKRIPKTQFGGIFA